jgi:class 3 adenylate cyclase
MMELMVEGVLAGLFEMVWDIHCPRCQQIAEQTGKLHQIHESSHCHSCRLDFENFADENITVSLSLHPKLFENELPQPAMMRTIDKRVTPVTVVDLITVARFRESFSDQIPPLNHSVKVRSVTVMFTDLIQSTQIYTSIGDFKAYALIREHFDLLFTEITTHAGGVIKTIGDAVMAVFHDPVTAIKVSFELKQSIRPIFNRYNISSGLKIGLASGAALVVNMNNILDLFGTTVNKAARIVPFSGQDDIALCHHSAQDAQVQEYLNLTPHRLKQLSAELKGLPTLTQISLLTLI